MKSITDRYGAALICVALAVVTLAVYWQVLDSHFVNFDDDIYVTDNRHVKAGLTGDSITWAFYSYDVSYWHPLTWLSHMLDCQLFGLRARMHHLTSLLIHIANSILLFLVLRRMTRATGQSAFVAAVFALHPINVDSVAWIAERKNVLSTLFWILTIWSYAEYARHLRVRWYLLALLVYMLGLLSKPMLVTLPFVMFLLDYWPLRRFRFHPVATEGAEGTNVRLVLEKLPFLALSVGAVFAFCWAVQRPDTVVPKAAITISLRMANALVSYVMYAAKMLWPSNLAVYYPYPNSVPLWQALGGLLFVGCVSVLVILWARRKPYLVMGWFWYLGTLVPVSGLYQVGLWPARADRWAYVPLIGLYVVLGWGIGEIAKKYRMPKSALAYPAGACIAAMMACAFLQVRHWRNSSTLFSRAVEVTRDNFIAHYNLGNMYLRSEQLDQAIRHYQKALDVHPRYVDARYALGVALSAKTEYAKAAEQFGQVLRLKGPYKNVLMRLADALARGSRVSEAIGYYEKALEQEPNNPEILNNLALALVEEGNTDTAIKHFERSLEINPKSAEALNNLGNALAKQDRLGEAITQYEKALRIKPNFAAAHYNLASAFRDTGKTQEAATHYTEAIRLRSDDVDAYHGLGMVLAEQQQYDLATEQFQKAIELDPNFAPAHYNIGRIFNEQRQTDKAIERFRHVLQLHPKDADMHCNLGILLLEKGSIEEAIESFRTAIELDPGHGRAKQQLKAALSRKNESRGG